MNYKTKYKNFEIDGLKFVKGFNQWTFNLIIYKNKGFKEEDYFYKRISTFEKSLKIALKEVYKFIDGLKEIPFVSNGMLNCPYYKSINEVL